MTTTTLGPYVRFGNEIHGPNALGNDDIVAEVHEPDHVHADRIGDLFAAAPDLLEACRYMVKVPCRLSGEQLATVKAAIAKAEGRA